MEFYSQLYIGESVKNVRRIVRKLKKGEVVKNAHIITFAGGGDLLEIYDAKIFAQDYYRDFDRNVVGIAGTYEEAVELVIKITEEALQTQGNCDVKAYLLSKITQERHE